MSRTCLRSLLLATLAAFVASANADTISISTASTSGWSVYHVDGFDFASNSNLSDNDRLPWKDEYFANTKTAVGFGIGQVWVDHWDDKFTTDGYAKLDGLNYGGMQNDALRISSSDHTRRGFFSYEYSLENLLPSNADSLTFNGTLVLAGGFAAAGLLGSNGSYQALYSDDLIRTKLLWKEYEASTDLELLSDVSYKLVFIGLQYDNNDTGLMMRNASISYTTAPAPPEGNAAPEPATLALFGMGIAGLAVARRRRK